MVDEGSIQKIECNVKKVWSELKHGAASISIYIRSIQDLYKIYSNIFG